MLINVLKTLPRDVRIVRRHLKTLLELRQLEKKNGTVGKVFDSIAKQHPSKPAFLFKDKTWTFQQVYEQSNRIANFFVQAGLKKGDRVSLFMENRPEFIVTWLGLSKIGVITALVNYNLRSISLKHSFDLTEPSKAIICSYGLAEAFQEARKNDPMKMPVFGTGPGQRDEFKIALDLDNELLHCSTSTPKEQENTGYTDELFLLYTSGTSGLPKAAIVKQCRFLMAGVAGRNGNKLSRDDIIYTTLPLYHTNAGIVGASQTLVNGCTMALREKFSASNFWTDCIKYNATASQYMGETMRYLLRQPVRPEEKKHKVRVMLGNGLRPEIWEEFVTRFGIKQISEIYGSTEGNVSTVNYENKVGACGFIPIFLKKIFPIKIVKLGEDGEPIRDPKTGLLVECKPGEVGELVGQIQMNHAFRDFKGYVGNEEANQKKILRDVFKKGDAAFRTGDMFMKDELEFLYFKDRMGETFRWKGENVSTNELEYVISNLTETKLDVVVFPVKVPHTEGTAGMAVVGDEDDTLNLDDLSQKIKKSLPSYSIPLFLRKVKRIEMTGTHKLKKTNLQKDGFDIHLIPDPIYFWDQKSSCYKTLTQDIYNNIQTGAINI